MSASIPGTGRSDLLDVCIARKSDHGLCDNVVAVHSLHGLVYLLAVEARRAGSGFEVDRQSRCRGVRIIAPRTSDIAPQIGART